LRFPRPACRWVAHTYPPAVEERNDERQGRPVRFRMESSTITCFAASTTTRRHIDLQASRRYHGPMLSSYNVYDAATPGLSIPNPSGGAYHPLLLHVLAAAATRSQPQGVQDQPHYSAPTLLKTLVRGPATPAAQCRVPPSTVSTTRAGDCRATSKWINMWASASGFFPST